MDKVFKKVFLIILDGFGLASFGPGNVISNETAPYINSLPSKHPSFSLVASSLTVGLPWGNVGNSEVGHSALGTGRIIIQDLARINQEIREKDFFKNPMFVAALDNCKKNKSKLHFVGCVSTGGIHSHIDHVHALMEFVEMNKFDRAVLHMITDGRDADPNEGADDLKRLESIMQTSKTKLGSIGGRMYGMDRVLNWPLTEKVWEVMVDGQASRIENAGEFLEKSYKSGLTDYEIVPSTLIENGEPAGLVSDNDSIIFFDYRNDRAKQLVTPFVFKDFDGFKRKKYPENLFIVTMTRYAEDLPVNVAYEPLKLENTLGSVVSDKGLKQLRVAEKEKEAHVTNFFNGGLIDPLPGEERAILSSRKLKGDEYAEHPEMSADAVVKTILEKKDDEKVLYVINFANGDMVAHTGKLEGSKKAMQVLDKSVKKLVEEISANPDNAIIITADHGNAEELIDPGTGAEDTQHSSRNVPIIFIGKDMEGGEEGKDLEALNNENPIGTLVDVAPSVLKLLGIEKPKEMSGSNLV